MRILRILCLATSTTTEEATFGKTDLSHFLQEATAGVNDPEELEHEFQLVQNALDFGNVKARDCMVPRTEIAALEIEDAMDELRALFGSGRDSIDPAVNDDLPQPDRRRVFAIPDAEQPDESSFFEEPLFQRSFDPGGLFEDDQRREPGDDA